MAIRVAINGFGRTGRSFLRAALASSHPLEVVAVNDLGSPQALARLFARDSVHGRYPEPVRVDGDSMVVGSRRITNERCDRCSSFPKRSDSSVFASLHQ